VLKIYAVCRTYRFVTEPVTEQSRFATLKGPFGTTVVVSSLNTVEISIKDSQRLRRLAWLALACGMLNVGLYFILYVITPVVVGCLIGFLLGHRWDSVTGPVVGTSSAYTLLFYYVVVSTGMNAAVTDIVAGALLMGLLSGLGGLIGMRVRGIPLRAH